MSSADLVGPDTPVAHPALVLGRLLPKRDPHDERIDKRGKCAHIAFQRAAGHQATIQSVGKAAARLRRLAVDLERGGVPVVSFTARCATRLITGSGGGLPEVNATLVHPVYGYPFIPGSSLKGAARAEAVRVDEPDLVSIFGGPVESDHEPGQVAFLDAVPMPSANQSPVLKVDVATVHHKRYYEQDLPEPLPTESPVPLPFLVVPARVGFRFVLAGTSPRVPGTLVASACSLLRTAMTEEGLGAATASGYGYLDHHSVNVDIGRDLIGGAL
ncbi:MAG: type III-B CRISPR module RAMP protein Cmr6 [Egibacteraceae bacterium]